MNKQQVERRVSDWKKRIVDLYTTIDSWLQNSEYSLRVGPKYKMFEELMYQFNVPGIMIESAEVCKNGKVLLTIKPKGLWVIGSNGRIDLLSSKGSFILVDFAEEFAPPRWQLYQADKINRVSFTKQSFFRLLNQ